MLKQDSVKSHLANLWQKALAGNQDEAVQLLGSLAPMFQRLAERLSPWLAVEAEDLVQDAYEEVWRCLGRYNPERGANFKTWAFSIAKAAMTAKGRVPEYYQRILRQAREAEAELIQKLERPPTTAEIAKRAGLSDEMVENAISCGDAARPVSLDPMLDEHLDEDFTHTGGRPKTPEALTIQPTPMNRDELEALFCALNELEAQSQQVVSLFYLQSRSHAEIAKAVGISEENSRQIMRRALSALLRLLKDEL